MPKGLLDKWERVDMGASRLYGDFRPPPRIFDPRPGEKPRFFPCFPWILGQNRSQTVPTIESFHLTKRDLCTMKSDLIHPIFSFFLLKKCQKIHTFSIKTHQSSNFWDLRPSNSDRARNSGSSGGPQTSVRWNPTCFMSVWRYRFHVFWAIAKNAWNALEKSPAEKWETSFASVLVEESTVSLSVQHFPFFRWCFYSTKVRNKDKRPGAI